MSDDDRIHVQMPDGNILDVPAGTTQAQIVAKMPQYAKAVAGPAASEGIDWAHKGNLILQAVGKGIAGIGSLSDDLAAGPQPTLSVDPATGQPHVSTGPALPQTAQMQASGEQPRTPGEQYLQSGIQGAAGGAVMPGGGVVRSAITGGLAGLGAQAGGNLGGEPGAVAGGLATGLLTHGVGNLASNIAPNQRAVAQTAMAGLSPADVAAAVQKQADLAKDGYTATANQVFNKPTNLDKLVELLANHPSGEQVQAALRGQPTEVVMAAQQALARINQQTGAEVSSMPQVANQVQDAATKVVQQAKDTRSSQVQPLYQQAGDIHSVFRNEFANTIKSFLAQPGLTDEAKAAANGALDKLDPNNNYVGTGKSASTHALDYDAIVNDISGPYKSNLNPASPKVKGQINQLAGQLDAVVKDASPQLKAADQKFAELSSSVVNPVKQGPVGQLAGKSGYQEDAQAPASKLNSLFTAGTANPGASDIATVAKSLNAQSPGVFGDAAITWLNNAIEAAPTRLDEGQSVPQTGGILKDKLLSSPAKRAGLNDMIAGIADGAGVDRAPVVAGFQRFVNILDAADKRPSNVSGMSDQDVLHAAGQSWTARAIKAASYMMPRNAVQSLEARAVNRTLGGLDPLLSSPDGLSRLAALARTDPGGKAQADAMAAIAATLLEGSQPKSTAN